MYQFLITNINTNQENDNIDNELEFDSSNILANNYVQDNLPIVNIILIGSKSLDINLTKV